VIIFKILSFFNLPTLFVFKTSPSLSQVSVSTPNLIFTSYSLSKDIKYLEILVALFTKTINKPSANGSSVPA